MTTPFLFVDFQTTGTVVDRSFIIEAGWALYDPDARELIRDESARVVRLPEGASLPRTIQKLTGISEEDMESAGDFAAMQAELVDFLKRYPEAPIVVHYATFKLPFLKKALTGRDDILGTIDARIVCTHRLSKSKIPALKSHSLRAVAGFAGYSAEEKKRVADHLRATAFVWRFLQDGQREEPSPGIARDERLAISNKPGIYIFRDAHGRILYVGKAARLKTRVNSYFRGRKTKGSRLNEMLTRAASIETRECGSELEALLRESDAIKEYDPPYNRLLRTEDRSLIFVTAESLLQQAQGGRYFGPFTSPWIFHFLTCLRDEKTQAGVFPGLDATTLREGWVLFAEQKGYDGDFLKLLRKLWNERPRESDEDPGLDVMDDEEPLVEEVEEEEFATTEDVAEFIESTLLQALGSLRRARFLMRLLYADIQFPKADLSLSLRGTDYSFEPLPWPDRIPSYKERMRLMNLSILDRLSAVLMQIRKSLKAGQPITLQFGPRLRMDAEAIRNYFDQ